MLIPIRCMTCGKPVGHLWEKYQEMVAKGMDPKKALDDLGLERYCCRSLLVTQVDLVDQIGKFKK